MIDCSDITSLFMIVNPSVTYFLFFLLNPDLKLKVVDYFLIWSIADFGLFNWLLSFWVMYYKYIYCKFLLAIAEHVGLFQQ